MYSFIEYIRRTIIDKQIEQHVHNNNAVEYNIRGLLSGRAVNRALRYDRSATRFPFFVNHADRPRPVHEPVPSLSVEYAEMTFNISRKS